MDQKQERIEHIARDSLTQFESVADAAQRALHSGHAVDMGVLASVNAFTDREAIGRLDRINRDNMESARILADEPAIARVAIIDESGNKEHYYFCRADQGMVNMRVISYLAPIGRLASLSVGDSFRLPNGSTVEVIESARFRPFQARQGWDSRDSVVEGHDFGPLTIESLRALLHKVAGEELAEDLLQQLLAEESQPALLFQCVKWSWVGSSGRWVGDSKKHGGASFCLR